MSKTLEPKSKSDPLLKFSAQFIAIAHTICALSAFLAALVVGTWLHYHKIVKNEFYGYPDEWFPSVSATIGDRYPERSIFQVIIALTAGPRFLLLLLNYIRLYKPNSIYPKLGLISGFIRTMTCGGWVYITSTDDHDAHDIFMVLYIVLTIPWDLSITMLTAPRSSLRRYRKYMALTFFFMLIPLIYLFIQHKAHKVKGAYSYYAYCEWSLIFLDVGFDALSIIDFKDLSIELLPSKNGDEYFSTNFNIQLIQKEIELNSKKEPSHSFSDPLSDSEKLLPKTIAVNNSSFEITINTLNSFIFWSIYSSLFLCIWHFPLWNMGISGYEATCLSLLAPFLLSIPGLQSFFAKKPAFPRFFACLFGVGSFAVTEPASRLLILSVGVIFAVMSLCVEISTIGKLNDPMAIKSYATTFSMGLILSSILKFAFWTNNPIWPIMNKNTGGWNTTGLIVGLTSAYFTTLPQIPVDHKKSADTQKPSLLVCSAAFGSLIYSISAMLTDSSTIILWTWSGYPISGPIPVPHGAVTLIVMCLGTYLGLLKSNSYKIVTIMGIIGAIFLYNFHDWAGYAGGMLYAFWVCYITPICFHQISKVDHVAAVFGIAYIFDILLSLGHVWVVAYAFVPYGPLLRERTDLIFGSSVLLICGIIMKYNIVEAELSTKKLTHTLKKFSNFFKLFTLLSVFVAFQRFQFEKPKPYHPESRLFTAGIWTIHFGLDNDMWASEHRMRDLIKDLELDVIGLLESDTQRIIMGNRDLTQRLAEELDMYADFGPGPNKHTWGAALLSKFPIVQSTHHLLPSPVGELAPAIHATLDCYGELVDIVVFHSGQEEDVEDRLLQSLGVAEIMGSSDRPLVLLSYLVTNPLEGNYNTYVSDDSGMHDIDATDDDRWCEYILYKKLKRTGYARISRGTITDTEVQVGKFVVPNAGEPYDEEYSQERVDESSVPLDMRFPSMFYGDGVRDHRFHVFDEPRYFD